MQHLSDGPIVRGKDFEGQATLVPYALLKNLRFKPTPCTFSTLTFTLNASVSNPVALWAGDDMVYQTTTSTYVWTSGSNAILDSTGAETTVTGSTTGVWYYYLSVNKNFTTRATSTTIIPSQTAPEGIDAEKTAGYLGHPGASATKKYLYLGGFGVCTTATTPVFRAMTKRGYTWSFAEQSVATTTTWAVRDFSASIPSHEGCTAAGTLETGATTLSTVSIGTSAVDDEGIQTVQNNCATTVAVVAKVPFSGVEITSAGQVYAKDTVARGDVHISSVTDVV